MDLFNKNKHYQDFTIKSLLRFAFDDNDEDMVEQASSLLCNIIELGEKQIGNFLKEINHAFYDWYLMVIESLPGNFSKNPKIFKVRLSIIVNLTRMDCFEEQFSKDYLVSDCLTKFSTLLKEAKNISSEVHHLVIYLILNLSRVHKLEDIMRSDKKGLVCLIIQIIDNFKESSDAQIRSNLIKILVNLLLMGEAQDVLIDEEHQLLVQLLLPLAGPTSDIFDEEDMQKLHIDLQYLPSSYEVEKNIDTKIAIVSCLLLCCSKRTGRETLKRYGTYYFLREMHKVEENKLLLKYINDTVDILIKDEEDYTSYHDLLKVDIPENMQREFVKIDEQLS